MIKIGFDIMGADLGPEEGIKAVNKFAKDFKDAAIYVYGEQQYSTKATEDNIIFVPCSEVIEMTDGVMKSMRKKDASMLKCIEDVENGITSGIMSSGNTGAYLALANMKLKAIEGVLRPALMPIIPNTNKDSAGSLLLDAGASTEISAEFMVQYAKMGSEFAKVAFGVSKPKVMLLNIGTEESKGIEEYVKAHKELAATDLNFQGNIEGRDLLKGIADVIVADGFTGNTALKVIEGTARTMIDVLKASINSSTKSKVGGMLISKNLKKDLGRFDYRNTGGALLIGVNGVVVKAHGSSDEVAYYHALEVCYNAVKGDVVKEIKNNIKG